MSTIVTRSGKGSPLTNTEVDANFTNLNTDKAELSGATFTGDVASTGFSGDITGAVLFQAKAGEGLTKGDPVYISGISGNQTVVSKADANDANKMPCFGIVDATVSINANCSIVTFGTLADLNTSAFSEGDELYISDTGTLLATAPTGEASQLQKIAKVTRSHASAGSIKVMGAGRTNATPNLDDGKFFLGNSSNQSASATFSTSVTGIALPLSGGVMSGAITTNSTFDGRDVATDGTKLDGIEASATADQTGAQIKTAYEAETNAFTDAQFTKLGGIEASADVTANAGALMDSELTSIASVKALNQGVATGDSPSFAGIVATTADINGGTIDGTVIGGATPAAISGTTGQFGTSLNVDGTATMDGLTVNPTTSAEISGAVSGNYILKLDNTHATSGNGLRIETPSTSASEFSLVVKSNNGSNNNLVASNNGDISFYEDTGTTAKLFWDASAESLGIGTSSPDTQLTLHKASTNADVNYLQIEMPSWAQHQGKLKSIVWDDGSNNIAGVGAEYNGSTTNIHFHSQYNGAYKDASVKTMSIMGNGNVGIGTSSPVDALDITRPSGTAARIRLLQTGYESWQIGIPSAETALTFSASGSEKMRLSGGTLLVGTTDTNPTNNSSNSTADRGIAFNGTQGWIGNATYNETTAYFNRTGTDGSIIELIKSGAVVGSIGSVAGSVYIGGTSKSLRMDTTGFRPATAAGAYSDNTVNLGDAIARFKDLYLSGGVYLGGTGAANKLEDYEEGTWTPTFSNLTGVSSAEGSYVKIGNLVTVSYTITSSGTTAITLNSSRITNLPFTISTAGGGRYVGSFTDASASSGLYGTHTLTGTTTIFTSSVSTGGVVSGSFTYRVA